MFSVHITVCNRALSSSIVQHEGKFPQLILQLFISKRFEYDFLHPFVSWISLRNSRKFATTNITFFHQFSSNVLQTSAASHYVNLQYSICSILAEFEDLRRLGIIVSSSISLNGWSGFTYIYIYRCSLKLQSTIPKYRFISDTLIFWKNGARYDFNELLSGENKGIFCSLCSSSKKTINISILGQL